jgi:hypothetical protein
MARWGARRLLLTCVLSLAGATMACEPGASPQVACRVTVDDETVVATFPLLQTPFVWRWLRGTTANDAMEYRWIAEFGQCSDRGIFEKGEYSFGLQLFKFPGDTERSGMLTDLLRRAQKDFMRSKQDGDQIHYSTIRGAKIDARYDAGSIIVRAHGKSLVTQLVTAHPQYAVLNVNIPDPGQSYTCFARVEYR